MTDGLKDAHRKAVIAVIAANDRVERAVLFGSRAIGTNTTTSDVDIALFGDRLTLTDQARLAAAVQEIPMAQSVDLILYDSIRDPTLRKHIRQEGVEWYAGPRRATGATVREVLKFAIGGGWGKETEFEDSVPVRVIRGTDFSRIRNGDYSGVPARYETPFRVGRRRLIAGDSLLEISGGSRTSNQSTGRSFFVSERVLKELGQDVIPASFCRLVRFNPDVVDTRYAHYTLQEMHLSGRASLYEQQSTGISNFQFEYFLDSEFIRLPSLREQRTIAHILGTLDDKIELNRRMNETLEGMARALFKSWFVDFDPVRAKIEGQGTGLRDEIDILFPNRFVDSNLGKIPSGWRTGTLKDLVSLNPESWTSRHHPDTVAYVDLANTKWGYIGKITSYPWKKAPSRARRVLRRGDTIVATVRPANGSFALVDQEGLTGSTGFAVLRPKELHDRESVWCAATSKTNIARLAHLADGAAYPAIRPPSVVAAPVALPDHRIRKAFSGATAPLLDRLEANKRESRSLATLRDVLLPMLVSGKINLRKGSVLR